MTVQTLLLTLSAIATFMLPDWAVEEPVRDDAMVEEVLCPVYAGPDTMVCGFEYALMGSEQGGRWKVLCSKSAGSVFFSSQLSDTTDIKVQRCGDYRFVYIVETGPCPGTDTVDIFFEDPSFAIIQEELEIDIFMNAPCYNDPPGVGCDNVIEIIGLNPPELIWEFCAQANCVSTIYSTDVELSQDSCIATEILCDTLITVDDDFSCLLMTDVTGDDILDVIGDAFDDLNMGCPIPIQCYEVPKECIDTIIDSITIFIPVLDGGLWNYVDSSGLIALSDTTFLTIEGKDYVFIIEPGSDYYGPDNLVFTLWEVVGGVWQNLTSTVDVSIQWQIEYVYDTLVIIDTTFIVNDSCEVLPCGGVTASPATIDIPPPPDFPCGPLNLSFGVGPDDLNYFVQINCANPGEDIEVCPGFVEVFDVGGVYFFTCATADGCPYEVIVEVYEDYTEPQITASTVCADDSLSYSVTLDITGGSGQFDLQGYGVFNYGDGVTIDGLTNCETATFYAMDMNSFCITETTVYHCCLCNVTTTNTQVVICEGESYDFFGRYLMDPGSYVEILQDVTGCDSLIRLDLAVNPASFTPQSVSICDGEVYDFYGQILTVSGMYEHKLTNFYGCDSILQMTLSVLASYDESSDTTICNGEILLFGNQVITEGGIYTHTFMSSEGCDSVVELTVSTSVTTFDIVASIDCDQQGEGVIRVENVSLGAAQIVNYVNNVATRSKISKLWLKLKVDSIDRVLIRCHSSAYILYSYHTLTLLITIDRSYNVKSRHACAHCELHHTIATLG